jgi:energy-coupling factor transport system permease protein
MFHPATLFLVWGVAVLVMQSWDGAGLLMTLVFVTIAAAWIAPERSRQLLGRTRWLLLSVCLIFVFGTPGEYLPGTAGMAGVTWEGIKLGLAHLARLLVLLLSLALLHQHLGTAGMLSGWYWLLRPFSRRNVTVVRLMLVLELVEQSAGPTDWRHWLDSQNAPESMTQYLPMKSMCRADYLLLVLAFSVLLYGWLS